MLRFTVYHLLLHYVLLCLDAKANHFVQLEMQHQGPRELQGREHGGII